VFLMKNQNFEKVMEIIKESYDELEKNNDNPNLPQKVKLYISDI